MSADGAVTPSDGTPAEPHDLQSEPQLESQPEPTPGGKPLYLEEAAEVRTQLAPLQVSLLVCQRFVRANDGKVGKAVKQYRGFLAWREAERIDEVLDEPLYEPEVEIELSRMSMRLIEVGNDLQDRPVMMAHLGNVDLQAAKKSHGITVGMMVRRHAKALEQLVRRIEESKTPLAGHLLIFNLANCTLSKFWHAWGYIREVAHMGQAYYPELLGKLCFVNGPVKAFWAIEKVKLLLNQATRDKVSVSSGDPTSLLESLLPPSTALPASFGLEWPSEAAGETVAGEAVAGEAVAGVKTAGEADKDTERSKMTAVASTERTESGRESVVVAAMEVAAAEKEETAAAEAESENAPTDPAMPQASDGYVPPPPLPWLTEIVMLRIGDGHSSGSGDQVEYNGSSSFPIETDFFSGMCHVRLRGLPGEPEEYFAGKKRQQSTVVQGRVKRPLQMSECSTGFEWHAPLRHMPRPLFLKPILKFFRTIAPAITIDVLSDRPLVLNPLFNAVQRCASADGLCPRARDTADERVAPAERRLHVALPGEQPEITSPFEEETTLLGGAFATKPLGWKDRKRMFASRASLPYASPRRLLPTGSQSPWPRMEQSVSPLSKCAWALLSDSVPLPPSTQVHARPRPRRHHGAVRRQADPHDLRARRRPNQSLAATSTRCWHGAASAADDHREARLRADELRRHWAAIPLQHRALACKSPRAHSRLGERTRAVCCHPTHGGRAARAATPEASSEHLRVVYEAKRKHTNEDRSHVGGKCRDQARSRFGHLGQAAQLATLEAECQPSAPHGRSLITEGRLAIHKRLI